MKFRSSLFIVCIGFFVVLTSVAWAAQGEADLKTRLALAKRMVEVKPVREQVEAAVDAYIKMGLPNFAKGEQEIFRATLLKMVNSEALEQAVLDSYAETFTQAELEAMIEYYEKPEARSATEKQEAFTAKIYPEIIKMLDQAIIRMRTSPQGP